MRRATALAATLTLALACAVIVVSLTDVPLRAQVPHGLERRAAVAIRDDVTPFQKWGSREFTLPYIEQHYGRAWYFTLSGDQHQVEEFHDAVGAALKQYAAVDLYLLAHSNKLIDWVAVLPEEDRARLRLVYNTGCTDLKQGPRWLELGAKAYVGHPGKSMSPVFYVYFLRRWSRGEPLKSAVAESNRCAFLAFDRLGIASLGALDSARVKAESEAFVLGTDALRIDGEMP